MIELPNCPPIASATPKLIGYFTDQTPTLGGPQSRVSRLGDRWGMAVETYPAVYAEEGRVYLARLLRGMTDTVTIAVPEPGLSGLDFGVPVVSAAAAGRLLPVSGLGAGRVVPEGKLLSIIVGGQRFLYITTAEVTASGAGVATLPIYPTLRRQPAIGATVELSNPKMEGFVQGNEQSWQISRSKRLGFSYAIMERE
ncbi:hypothetical protein [Brevundimonas vesicularis]|uniref:Uncharacterized protein n=1 Tax=Brevundimonas vesicularis TaxID=41276 RepID=A0A1Z3U5B8_BREVE|nr:hypothetical protein [Brevundimonas vesicularis]ASE38476.1 hypothetical protein CEP68_02560 [Brevundimonas vesicularis]